jgi:hypothetical protein
MAKRKVNKTAMIRDYMAKHPNAGPSKVAEALRAHKISASYVSNVTTKLKKRPRQRPSTRTGYASSVENIIAAAEFIKSCGGIDEAIEAFEIAQKVAQALD